MASLPPSTLPTALHHRPPPAAYYFTRSILMCIRTLEGKDQSIYDAEWKGWVLTGFFFLDAWLLGGWWRAVAGAAGPVACWTGRVAGAWCFSPGASPHLAAHQTPPTLPRLPQALRCSAWPLAACAWASARAQR